MAYVKTNWVDEETPLSAENMNKMEEGIKTLDTEVENLSEQLSDRVERKYLGQNPDINTKRFTAGIYGLYGCVQAPNDGLGTLEVIFYSPDWVIQRFTTIETTPRMWERSFTSGTTWNGWIRRW